MKTALVTAWIAVWVYAIVFGLGQLYIARASADPVMVQMETCQYEDGNLNGRPCIWIDPDTGDGYFVTSEAYRDEF